MTPSFACEFILPETGQPCGREGLVVEIGFEVIRSEPERNGTELRYYGHLCPEHAVVVREHGWETPA